MASVDTLREAIRTAVAGVLGDRNADFSKPLLDRLTEAVTAATHPLVATEAQGSGGDMATGIRAMLARAQRLDENGYFTHGGSWAAVDEEENR